MIHVKRIDESRGLNIEKSDVSPYYTVKRLYKKPSGYEWIDEDRTFNTVDDAERFIKVNAGQGERYSTNKFQIFEERPVEMVDVDGLYESVSVQNWRRAGFDEEEIKYRQKLRDLAEYHDEREIMLDITFGEFQNICRKFNIDADMSLYRNNRIHFSYYMTGWLDDDENSVEDAIVLSTPESNNYGYAGESNAIKNKVPAKFFYDYLMKHYKFDGGVWRMTKESHGFNGGGRNNKRLDETKRYNGDDYRVYLVRRNGGDRDIDPNTIDDDEFMGLAENDGSVWTLDGFAADFNGDGVPVDGASIRILPASVFGAGRLVRPRFKFNSHSEDDYRVYLVSYDNPAVANERGVFEYKIDDETFMDAAEEEGDVYSLKGFQEAFNNDSLDYTNKHMRIIPRKVWCTASRRAFESAGDEYLYGGVRGAAPRTAYLEGAWLKVNSGSLLFNVEKCTEENGSVTAVCGIVKQKGSGKHTIVIPEALVDGLLDGERVDCTFDGDPATVSIQGASIHSMLTKHMFDRKYTPNRTRFNSVRIGERDA